MNNNKITITLTSCGRFQLLDKTIESLIKYWDGDPPTAFFINEDSGLALPSYIALEIVNAWPMCRFKSFEGTKNQIAAIDRMYKEVQNPYIFHCEDDWEFYKKGFIKKSMDVLEADPNILQVWIRDPKDRNGHRAIGLPKLANNRTKYQILANNYCRGMFPGFSFNPGLRRLSDYQRIFPEGYSGVTKFNIKDPLRSESEVGQYYKKAGMKAATLLEGYVKHIGNGFHVGG
jgi:hypothetical protein